MNRIGMTLLALALLLTAGPAFSAPAPAGFDAVLGHYETIRKALINDAMAGIPGHAAEIAKLAKGAPADLAPQIAGAAKKLTAAKDLKTARDAFYELSKPMVRWREAADSKEHVMAYCSMSKRLWIQPKGEIGNPYYGKSMATCGEVVSK
ncbi:MAG TPA: hypothetical protein VH394_15045 [Thermoanaerobaculia bacterium]|jgi:hypothetical protein|nr:hypothetical protein [Thermoanaerobaculia bacterium]